MVDEIGIETDFEADRVLNYDRILEKILGRLRSESAPFGRTPRELTGRKELLMLFIDPIHC